MPVFDVAQTDGEELPSICNRLDGDDPAGHLRPARGGGAVALASRVEDARASAAATNGDCSHCELHRIRVEESQLTGVQRVKTLAHEIAHAILHERLRETERLAELEAESTAYVVCARRLASTPGDYSFGYVATWAGGGEEAIAGIKASCERIQKTAATILRVVDPASEQEVAA